ncbi:PaaI family thioesterase [Nocardioides deserti]|uniref:PaaI family thioesterase n=2 Tax=Nocardioides deserti TaxID=1588644 RepID=A0ABR6UB28_9ACTN|nr:PaaI family thioesterase [Nocardioides deserti]MBC2961656.1 PaaI family thioesterase [Nocardioides deserti]GGO76889.1 thioesterase [Nocardioides deserti]
MTETQETAAAKSPLDPASMSGFELLMAMRDGLFPPAPIAETLGMVDFDGEPGSISVALEPEHRHYNPLGTVHGGVISTMLDTAAGCSVHSTLTAGEGYTSLDLTVKFLRPATVESGRLRAVGRVVHRGRRTALAEAQLFDARDRLVAHATSSCMIFA